MLENAAAGTGVLLRAGRSFYFDVLCPGLSHSGEVVRPRQGRSTVVGSFVIMHIFPLPDVSIGGWGAGNEY